jgi:DNA-binding MarR family transcriptional regulator
LSSSIAASGIRGGDDIRARGGKSICDRRHTTLRLGKGFRFAIITDVEPTARKQARKRSPSKADRELGYRLGALMLRCMSSDGGTMVRALDESGLGLVHVKLLMTLYGPPGEAPTMSSVAEKLGLSLPSASRAVDWLVKRDYVIRTEDPDDRRARRLELTDAGDELAHRLLAARLEGLGQFAASLSEKERERLGAALELLLEREEIADVYHQFKRQAHT